MATTVAALVAELGRRMRDPDHLAHSAADKEEILLHCQRVVASANHTAIVQVDATYAATGFPLIDFINVNLLRVERIQIDDHSDLDRIDWRSLANHNPRWLSVRGRPRVWDMIGRQYVLVWPQPLTTITVTLFGTHRTGFGDAALELPDEYAPGVLTMAEQLLLLRQRLFLSIAPSAEHGKADIYSGRAT